MTKESIMAIFSFGGLVGNLSDELLRRMCTSIMLIHNQDTDQLKRCGNCDYMIIWDGEWQCDYSETCKRCEFDIVTESNIDDKWQLDRG